MSKMHIASTAVPYTHSLRVTLSLAKGKVQILNATRVAMRAPGAPPSPPTRDSSGFWFEIRDKEGKLIYYRPLPHPDLDSLEVFDDPEGGTIRRVPASPSEIKIDLILPDLPQASEFLLYGAERSADRYRPSVELDRKSMDSLRETAQRGQQSAQKPDREPSNGNGGTL
jgi:hypothetical protein